MTNNKQQTAVEWFGIEMGKLFAQYHGKIICIGEFHAKRFELEKQAKEMEKERIENAFCNGDNTDCTSEQNIEEFAEQYYNETYNQNK